jgi:hypothetical protein
VADGGYCTSVLHETIITRQKTNAYQSFKSFRSKSVTRVNKYKVSYMMLKALNFILRHNTL